MKINTTKFALIVRMLLVTCIAISISLMYYVNVVKKDYYIYTNPGGPNLSDT